jgi:hypothetical protein
LHTSIIQGEEVAMTHKESIEVPLTIEVSRSVLHDVSDNINGSREVELSTTVRAEPNSVLMHERSRSQRISGPIEDVQIQLAEKDSLSPEETALAVLNRDLSDSVEGTRHNLVEQVGKVKARASLGGFILGACTGGGLAVGVNGIFEKSPGWIMVGSAITFISGGSQSLNHSFNKKGGIDPNSSDEIARRIRQFEHTVERR